MRHEAVPTQSSRIEIALGAAVVIVTLLFALSGGGGRDGEFDRSLAEVNAHLQALGQVRREMQRHAADPAKGDALRKKWQESRSRADELMTQARGAARTDEQRHRVEQLAIVINSVVQQTAQLEPRRSAAP